MIKRLLKKIKDYFVLKKIDNEIDKAFKDEMTQNLRTKDIFDLELSDKSTSVNIRQQDNEYKYVQGLLNLKKEINSLVGSEKTTENYEKILSKYKQDLLVFAKNKSQLSKAKQILKKALFKEKTKDVSNRKEKKEMISTRINHMYELQDYKLKRQLLRDIKQAEKKGNLELTNKLKKEFSKKYM